MSPRKRIRWWRDRWRYRHYPPARPETKREMRRMLASLHQAQIDGRIPSWKVAKIDGRWVRVGAILSYGPHVTDEPEWVASARADGIQIIDERQP